MEIVIDAVIATALIVIAVFTLVPPFKHWFRDERTQEEIEDDRRLW